MRYLAIDIGDRRTGLAVGDSVTRIVTPAGRVDVPIGRQDGHDLLEALAGRIAEHLSGGSPGELVVGLPLNMDGSEGPRAAFLRESGARLAHRTGRVVHLQDERLTTDAAAWSMARSGRTRGQKKARRDAAAAAIILSDFFAQLPPTGAANDPRP